MPSPGRSWRLSSPISLSSPTSLRSLSPTSLTSRFSASLPSSPQSRVSSRTSVTSISEAARSAVSLASTAASATVTAMKGGAERASGVVRSFYDRSGEFDHHENHASANAWGPKGTSSVPLHQRRAKTTLANRAFRNGSTFSMLEWFDAGVELKDGKMSGRIPLPLSYRGLHPGQQFIHQAHSCVTLFPVRLDIGDPDALVTGQKTFSQRTQTLYHYTHEKSFQKAVEFLGKGECVQSQLLALMAADCQARSKQDPQNRSGALQLTPLEPGHFRTTGEALNQVLGTSEPEGDVDRRATSAGFDEANPSGLISAVPLEDCGEYCIAVSIPGGLCRLLPKDSKNNGRVLVSIKTDDLIVQVQMMEGLLKVAGERSKTMETFSSFAGAVGRRVSRASGIDRDAARKLREERKMQCTFGENERELLTEQMMKRNRLAIKKHVEKHWGRELRDQAGDAGRSRSRSSKRAAIQGGKTKIMVAGESSVQKPASKPMDLPNVRDIEANALAHDLSHLQCVASTRGCYGRASPSKKIKEMTSVKARTTRKETPAHSHQPVLGVSTQSYRTS